MEDIEAAAQVLLCVMAIISATYLGIRWARKVKLHTSEGGKNGS